MKKDVNITMVLENDLGNDDIKQLVLRIALPSMLAQFVSVFYSIIDRMYIGNIAQVGSIALAGVGICGPVITMIGSIASLVGIGGAPLMSMRLGENRKEEATKIMANAFLMLIIFSIISIGIIYPIRLPMLQLFGASPTTLPYADTYFSVYLTGTIFALLATGMNQFIICQGYSKVGMKSVLIGAILNIILDPIFIFYFHMGVKGAAIATVLSQLASCIFVIYFLMGENIPVRIRFGNYHLKTMLKILKIGMTPFLIIAFDNIMIIAMNALLQRYGGASEGDLLVTCATIAQSFMLVVTMPLGGITGGTQTILAFNYGAKQPDRVKKAEKYIVLLSLLYTTLLFFLAWFAGSIFVRLFTSDAMLAKEAFKAIRICTLMIIPLAVQYTIVDGLTGLGQVQYSLPLSMLRKTIYFIALFILPSIFGARAIFYAEPISDILSPLISCIVYYFAMKKILKYS